MKTPASDQKLRGGYYTPSSIARFLTDWAIRRPTDQVLEPSSGDGAFLGPAIERLRELGASHLDLMAVELDADAAQQSRSRLQEVNGARLHEGDFFTWAALALARGDRYDAILGNPPFLRFAYFKDEHRSVAFELMRQQHLRPTKLTNAWVPFVSTSAALLKPGGRLAMVLPGELLQVTYAAELRRYLADYFDRVTVFAFDRLVFEGIQQEVVLLTAERTASGPPGIRVVELEDARALSVKDHDWVAAPVKRLDHDTEKWIQYFLSPQELDAVRSLRRNPALRPLADYAAVDVGVVTGMNEFFVLDANGSTRDELKEYASPIVTRSNQLVGARLTPADWQGMYESGQARLLLSLDNQTEPTGALADYLAEGISRDVHLGYKCRIRRNWYVVPSRWRPTGFMLRQVHTFPKLAINQTDATSTDTVHRVAFHNADQAEAVVAAFHNPATFLAAEVFGRSYGGGVLELEPSEAEHLLVPDVAYAPPIEQVDAALRTNDIERLLHLGNIALTAAADLSPDELRVLRSGWERLQNRRLRRKQRSHSTQIVTAGVA